MATITTVDNQYYVFAVQPIQSIGGDGYTDDTSINANPGFTTSGSVNAVAVNYLPVTVAGEKWIDLNYTGRTLTTPTATHPVNSFSDKREAEISVAFVVESGYTGGGNTEIIEGRYGDANFVTASIGIIQNPSTLEWTRLRLFTQGIGGPGTIDVDLGFDFTFDQPFYVTLRAKSITDTGADDTATGEIEVYINDVLEYSDYAFQWAGAGNSGRGKWNNIGTSHVVRGRNTDDASAPFEHTFVKNISVFDIWSSDQGVSPGPYRVYDLGGELEEVGISYYVDNTLVAISYLSSPTIGIV